MAVAMQGKHIGDLACWLSQYSLYNDVCVANPETIAPQWGSFIKSGSCPPCL